jgi:Protein of unknown function (DUF1360)
VEHYRLILAILATWRITHLLFTEDGPWDVLVRLRAAAGRSVFGSLLDCFYCLSLWVAVAPASVLGRNRTDRLLLWPAISAGAIVLEQSISNRNEDQSHVVLWEGEGQPPRGDVS